MSEQTRPVTHVLSSIEGANEAFGALAYSFRRFPTRLTPRDA